MPSKRRSVNLWLDGFCIPTWKEVLTIRKAKECIEMDIKDAAIAQMNPTYLQAQKTLIVDYEVSGVSAGEQGLQQYASCGDCKNEDFACQNCITDACRIIVHIYCSIWMSRVWTRQEASLSNNPILSVPCLASTHPGSYGFLSVKDLEWFRWGQMYNIWKSRVPRDKIISCLLDRFCGHQRYAIKKPGEEGRGLYKDVQDMFGQTLEQKLKANDFMTSWNTLLDLSTTKVQDVASVMALLVSFGIHMHAST